MVSETMDLVLRILGMVGALAGTSLGLAKGMRWLSRERRQTKHEAARWEIEAFQANIAALKAENDRCWAEIDRERSDHARDCERLEATITRRQDTEHELRNQLHKANTLIQVLQLELDQERRKHGKGPWHPNENGDPQ